MTFSLVILLYIYLGFLILWGIFSLIGFYHLVRFGSRMFGSYFIGVLYIAGSLILLYLTYSYLTTINWETEITIFENFGKLKDSLNSSSVFN